MKIRKLHYNWHMCGDPKDSWGEDFDVVEVGVRGVTNIVEYMPMNEGYKWHFDVFMEDGSMRRIFNPNEVFYEKEEE